MLLLGISQYPTTIPPNFRHTHIYSYLILNLWYLLLSYYQLTAGNGQVISITYKESCAHYSAVYINGVGRPRATKNDWIHSLCKSFFPQFKSGRLINKKTQNQFFTSVECWIIPQQKKQRSWFHKSRTLWSVLKCGVTSVTAFFLMS